MDYKKIIDNIFKNKSNYVLEKFIEFKNQSRSFDFAFDKIKWNLSTEGFESMYGSNHAVFSEAMYLLGQFENLYEKGASIALIFEKEIYEEYGKNIKDKKIYDFNNNEILNYTYSSLVNDLIEYDTLVKIERRLEVNKELYELIYKFNIFNQFTVETFSGDIIDKNLYKKLFYKYYPNKQLPIAIMKKNEYDSGTYEIIRTADSANFSTDQRIINDFNSSIQQEEFIITEKNSIKTSIDQLSKEEKSFLFHVMCKALSDNKEINSSQTKSDDKPFNLPATELCRLMKIIEIKDMNSFDKDKYRDTVQYKVLTKGIEYVDKDKRIIFIDTLLKNIKNLNLSETQKYIRSILTKEHTNQIKLNKLPKNQ